MNDSNLYYLCEHSYPGLTLYKMSGEFDKMRCSKYKHIYASSFTFHVCNTDIEYTFSTEKTEISN